MRPWPMLTRNVAMVWLALLIGVAPVGAQYKEPPQDGPMMGYQLTRVMGQEDFDYAVELLALSDAQRATIEQFAKEYQIETTRILEQRAPGIRKNARSAADAMSPRLQPAYVPAMEGMVDNLVQLRDAIKAQDDTLFSKLETLITAEQKQGLDRFRLLRQRQRSDRLFADVPSVQIDLSELIRQQGFDADVRRLADGELQKYEQAVTPLMVQFDHERKAQYKASASVSLRVNQITWNRPPDYDQQNLALTNELLRISRPQGELQGRIGEINKEFVVKIGAKLPPEAGAKFIADYKLKVYLGRVYPDALDPRETLDALIAFRPLADGEEEAVRLLCDEFTKKYEFISGQMEEIFDRRRAEYAITHTSSNDSSTEKGYGPEMREFRKQRWMLNKGIVEQIAGIAQAPPDSPAGTLCNTYRKKHERALEAAETDRFPGH